MPTRITRAVVVAFLSILTFTGCNNEANPLSLPLPVITSLQPDTGAPGTEILITGNNFGDSSSQIRILVGGQVPQGITAVEPGKSVRFLVPTLEANKYEVQLILGDRPSNSKSFTVLDPTSTTEPGFTTSLDKLELETRFGAAKTGDTNLSITPQNGFTGEVGLTLQGAPPGMSIVPNKVQVSGKDAIQTATHLELASGVKPGNYAVTLLASAGGIERKTVIKVPVGTFGMDFTGGPIFNIAPGSSIGNLKLSITPWAGFSGDLSISLIGAPSELSITPASSSVSSSANSSTNLSLNLAANAPMGRYQFMLHVSADGFARDVLLTAQVANFAASLAPNPIVADVGSSQNVTLKLEPAGLMACRIGLSDLTVNGISTGVSVTPSEFPVDSSTPIEKTLTIAYTNGTLNGGANPSSITLSCNGIRKTLGFTSQLRDATIAKNQSSLTLAPGTSKPFSSTITPRGGFTGPITVSFGNLPAGVSIAPASAQVTVTGPNPVTQNFTMTAASNASASTQTVQVNAQTDTFARGTNLNATVATITGMAITSSSNDVQETTSQNLSASVTGSSGFEPAVTWSIVSGPGSLSNASGASVTYTAPSVSVETPVTLKATSNWDATKNTTKTLTIKPVVVTINSEFSSVPAGYLENFTATSSSITDPGVTWEYSSGTGVVDGNSLKLTTPNSAGGIVTVTAKSIFNTSRFATKLITVVGRPTFVKQTISGGGSHSLALRTDGSLWTWGSNQSGQLGDGTTTSSLIPKQIMTGATSVSAGGFHSLALKSDGSLWAWGDNKNGQLGDGTTTSSSVPKQIMTGVANVSAGYFHSLALKSDGSLWAWGSNADGRLGDGTFTNSSVPKQIMTSVASASAGQDHSLALKSDGSFWAWGSNSSGLLGNGTTTSSSVPKQIMTGVANVSAGYFHSLALKPDGSLWAWGNNGFGQLGDGTTTNNSLVPKQIMTGVASFSAGRIHSLALKSDGSLWAWGSNSSGLLGNGTTTDSSTPIQIMTGVKLP